MPPGVLAHPFNIGRGRERERGRKRDAGRVVP